MSDALHRNNSTLSSLDQRTGTGGTLPGRRRAIIYKNLTTDHVLRRFNWVGIVVLFLTIWAISSQRTISIWAAEVPNADGSPKKELSESTNSPAPTPIANVSNPYGAQAITTSSKMAERIDELLARHWQRHEIEVAKPTTDTEFLRRAYLDLTGRIPKVSEVYDYNDDSKSDRRIRLVDQLLDHRDHSTHLAAVWRRFLLPDGVDLSRYGGTSGLEHWLVDRFFDNTPYDQTVLELLQAEGRVTEPGPVLFYTALNLNPEEIASQTARAFLGMRMECAQCHDHPFDGRWSQHDFWGYAAFFARISRPKGKMNTVSAVMRVRDSDRGDAILPDSDEIVPPRFPEGELLDEQSGSKSRRQAFAHWLTQENREQLARATVNRVWSQFFGLGLVEPVDDMRPSNPAVSPEVLDELSQFFVRTSFDLRKLIRTIVLTNAYQLSSRATVDDPERLRNFGQMNIKAFTAEQVYDCIAMATRIQTTQASPNGQEALMRFDNSSRQAFLEQFRAPPGQPTEYHAGIPQALTLMNGGLVSNATDMSRSGLLKSFPPFFSDEQRVETLFLATLSRQPTDSDRALMLPYVKTAQKKEEKQQALGNILWALLNSGEFTMNH